VTLTDEQEHGLINQLLNILRITERWIETTYPAAQAGSAFMGDDARTHPYEVSHQANRSMGVAVDHLHSMRMALTGTGDNVLGLHTFAPLSLTRAALENGATAVWLCSPKRRTERILRRLRLEMASIKATASFFAQPEAKRDAELQRRKDRVYDIGDRVKVVRDAVHKANPNATEEEIKRATRLAINKRPTPTEIVTDAGVTAQLIDGQNNLAHMLWRICSAVAHGDNWVLTLFDLKILGASTRGVTNVRITSPTPLLVASVEATMAMLSTAHHLYGQRTGTTL
jgi:hypothetical protein